LKQTWRWFGPADPVDIYDLPQIGVQGVVTSLDHIPPGAPWSKSDIRQRQADISKPTPQPTGLNWEVVENLPVSEVIKTKGTGYAAHIATYKESLHNLAGCGIQTVCYNFMPVLDWTRTNLAALMPHGGTAMAFDVVDFALFDLHLLARPAAEDDYSTTIKQAAEARFNTLDDSARTRLINTIVAGVPGANNRWTLSDLSGLLSLYKDINKAQLRANLIDFLSEVVPVAEEHGMRLCCHPDDPPFPLMGLPRVLSSTADFEAILSAIDTPANGAALCTGSLSVAPGFDVVDFVSRLGPRIHFAQLSNTRRKGASDGPRVSFHEAVHLDGETDMVIAIRALLKEEARRKAEGRSDWEIPMRPGHGQHILYDLHSDTLPGYPLIGRTKGLAELRGVMAALSAGS
jgi:mannonate dehydratase